METAIRGQTVTIQVLVNGQPQPIYRRSRDNMPFVEAVIGAPYVIRVMNNMGARLEVISSVDGRNTLDNEPANPVRNSGMVISGVWDITGFRLSDQETAQFIFSDPSQALSTQVTGASSNVGVIGIATYREYIPQPVYRSMGGTRGGLESYSVPKGLGLESSDVGTAAGQTIHDAVGHTTFTRASQQPVDNIAIQYRTRDWLERNNILAPVDPNPWPGYTSDTGYAFLRR